MEKKLTQKELKRQLHYDPDTGIFIWLVSKSNHVKIGSIAGCLNKENGYVQIKINYKHYKAQRLAFLYMEGYFPEYEIDHKNGIRDDNRWSEIKHVTHACNMQNQKIRNDNKSGFIGVMKSGDKWSSQIRINGKRIYLGTYLDILEAALARFTAEVWCLKWKCNYRSKLISSIKRDWPEFKPNWIVENNHE